MFDILLHWVVVDYERPIEAVVPGAQGQVLAALARTETELTMRALAQLAGTSIGQTSLVVGRLVLLGLVTRRDVGTASLVRLDRRNEATRTVLALAQLHQRVVRRLRTEAAKIKPPPVSLVVFGSFARGQAHAASDLDVLAV